MHPTEHIGFFTPPQPTKTIAGDNFGYSGKKMKFKKRRTWVSIHCPERELIKDDFNKSF